MFPTTTVVGSFPTKPALSIALLYPKKEDPFESAIKDAVEAQIQAGVDIVSDGQVRNDFVRIFTEKIGGYKGTTVEGKVRRPTSITAHDFEFAKKVAAGRSELKGILTGPNTIALSSRVAPGAPYSSHKDLKLAEDLANILCEEARDLERLGAKMISIDEPFFSSGIALDGRVELVDKIAKCVSVPVALHVCGDVRSIFGQLLQLKHISILDHELCATPKNFEVITRANLEKHGKRIACGVLSSCSECVESIEELKKRIKTVINLFGSDVIIKPDCGLRHITFEVACEKLADMCSAVKAIR